MKLYTIRSVADNDEFTANLSQIVRIYRDKGKVTFSDGSVIRITPTDIDRLMDALSGMSGMEQPY